ncbi:predicted protein [Nematostella vectensis]|uniref:PDZ domain-containing protein n=1 Tax=Nematostella vectensis TaxID=45351 RepID=A7SN22_NEMVE|nr:predicted protein [Nematostella vectensis]|eukprot:XP_001626990.1 predicted protein [Nematostella vectensis]
MDEIKQEKGGDTLLASSQSLVDSSKDICNLLEAFDEGRNQASQNGEAKPRRTSTIPVLIERQVPESSSSSSQPSKIPVRVRNEYVEHRGRAEIHSHRHQHGALICHSVAGLPSSLRVHSRHTHQKTDATVRDEDSGAYSIASFRRKDDVRRLTKDEDDRDANEEVTLKPKVVNKRDESLYKIGGQTLDSYGLTRSSGKVDISEQKRDLREILRQSSSIGSSDGDQDNEATSDQDCDPESGLGNQGSPVPDLNSYPDNQGSPVRDLDDEPDNQGSPVRDLYSDTDNQGSPVHDLDGDTDNQGSPVRDLDSDPHNQGSPVRDLDIDPDNQGSPFRDLDSDPNIQGSPIHDLNSDPNIQGSPVRGLDSDPNNQGSPIHDLNSDPNIQGSPVRGLDRDPNDQGSPVSDLDNDLDNQDSPVCNPHHASDIQDSRVNEQRNATLTDQSGDDQSDDDTTTCISMSLDVPLEDVVRARGVCNDNPGEKKISIGKTRTTMQESHSDVTDISLSLIKADYMETLLGANTVMNRTPTSNYSNSEETGKLHEKGLESNDIRSISNSSGKLLLRESVFQRREGFKTAEGSEARKQDERRFRLHQSSSDSNVYFSQCCNDKPPMKPLAEQPIDNEDRIKPVIEALRDSHPCQSSVEKRFLDQKLISSVIPPLGQNKNIAEANGVRVLNRTPDLDGADKQICYLHYTTCDTTASICDFWCNAEEEIKMEPQNKDLNKRIDKSNMGSLSADISLECPDRRKQSVSPGTDVVSYHSMKTKKHITVQNHPDKWRQSPPKSVEENRSEHHKILDFPYFEDKSSEDKCSGIIPSSSGKIPLGGRSASEVLLIDNFIGKGASGLVDESELLRHDFGADLTESDSEIINESICRYKKEIGMLEKISDIHELLDVSFRSMKKDKPHITFGEDDSASSLPSVKIGLSREDRLVLENAKKKTVFQEDTFLCQPARQAEKMAYAAQTFNQDVDLNREGVKHALRNKHCSDPCGGSSPATEAFNGKPFHRTITQDTALKSVPASGNSQSSPEWDPQDGVSHLLLPTKCKGSKSNQVTERLENQRLSVYKDLRRGKMTKHGACADIESGGNSTYKITLHNVCQRPPVLQEESRYTEMAKQGARNLENDSMSQQPAVCLEVTERASAVCLEVTERASAVCLEVTERASAVCLEVTERASPRALNLDHQGFYQSNASIANEHPSCGQKSLYRGRCYGIHYSSDDRLYHRKAQPHSSDCAQLHSFQYDDHGQHRRDEPSKDFSKLIYNLQNDLCGRQVQRVGTWNRQDPQEQMENDIRIKVSPELSAIQRSSSRGQVLNPPESNKWNLNECAIHVITVPLSRGLRILVKEGSNGVMVNAVLEGGDAGLDGRLLPGDRLLAIDEHQLDALPMQHVKSVLCKLTRAITNNNYAVIRFERDMFDNVFNSSLYVTDDSLCQSITLPNLLEDGGGTADEVLSKDYLTQCVQEDLYPPMQCSTPDASKSEASWKLSRNPMAEIMTIPGKSSACFTNTSFNYLGNSLTLQPNNRVDLSRMESALSFLGLDLTENQRLDWRYKLGIDADSYVNYQDFVKMIKDINDNTFRIKETCKTLPTQCGTPSSLPDTVPQCFGNCVPNVQIQTLLTEKDRIKDEVSVLKKKLNEKAEVLQGVQEELANVRRDLVKAKENRMTLHRKVARAETSKRNTLAVSHDYESAIKKLELNIAELKEANVPVTSTVVQKCQDVQKQINKLVARLRRTEKRRQNYYIATQKLMAFALNIYEVLKDDPLTRRDSIRSVPSDHTYQSVTGGNLAPGIHKTSDKRQRFILNEAIKSINAARSLLSAEPLPLG